MNRLLYIVVAGIALAAVVTSPVLAAAPTPAAHVQHSWTIVSAATGKLVVNDGASKTDQTYNIQPNAKIMLDGKPAKFSDLKKGYHVKVTTERKNGAETMHVAATSK